MRLSPNSTAHGCSGVGQVPDLPRLEPWRGARPWPFLDSFYQAGMNRIPLDVVNDPVELSGIAHPVIIRLILPERPSTPSQNPVCQPGTGALDCPGHFPQRLVGLNQSVDMVGHNHPCEELVQFPLLGAGEQGVHNTLSDACLLQPGGTGRGPIHFPVESQESSTLRGCGIAGEQVNLPRQGAIQSPGKKYRNSFRMPMGQPAPIEAHNQTVAETPTNSHWAGRGPAPQG